MNDDILDIIQNIVSNSIFSLSTNINKIIQNEYDNISKQYRSYTLAYVDDLMTYWATFFGYGRGDLRIYYYNYLGDLCLTRGLQKWEIVDIYDAWKEKVVVESEYMNQNQATYMNWYFPVVNNHIVPSTEKIYNYAKSFRQKIDWELEDLLYKHNYQGARITGIDTKLNDFINDFSYEVEVIVTEFLNGWYITWNDFLNNVFYDLEQDFFDLQTEVAVLNADVIQLELFVNRNKLKIEKNSENILWLTDLLEKPVSSFLVYKTKIPELYWSELDVLNEVIDDFLSQRLGDVRNYIINNFFSFFS